MFSELRLLNFKAWGKSLWETPVPLAPITVRLELSDTKKTFTTERQSRGGYLLGASGYEPRRIGNRLDARRSFAPERSVAFSPDALVKLGAEGSQVQDLSLKLTHNVGRIAYLGPLRQPPERTYLWSRQTPGLLGERGQNAVGALLASANSRRKRKQGEEGGRGWLVEQASKWLKKLGIADSLEMVRQGRSRFFEVIVKTGGQDANIVDVGFGVSQILPFVVLAYFVPRGTTIIAEQPEIHLHPHVQAGLANLMTEVARKRGVQFIVETHSEHLFRRMQFLVADEKVRPNKCKLYFVEARKGKAKLLELEMDPYGRVANWPKHFFGDATGEIERQTRRMLARLRRQREVQSG